MSKKDDLTEIFNKVASMTPEEQVQYELQQIKNKQLAVENERKVKDTARLNELTRKEEEERLKRNRMEEEKNYELALAPEAFKKRYNELKQLDAKIRSLEMYGAVDRIPEINELKSKFEKILTEIKTVAWKDYPITFVEQPSYASKVNPEHKLIQENNKWRIQGFEDMSNANATFEFNPETGLPARIKSTKKIMRLFGKPVDVPVEHEITYVTEEDLAKERVKEAEERGKRGYGKLVKKSKQWSCTRCHKVNDDKFCSGCGKPRENWQ